MSYMEPGFRFFTEPTHKRFVPKIWIADGIRRSVEDGSLEPGARFITEEDYVKMSDASEIVATSMGRHTYRFGKFVGFFIGFGASLFLGVIVSLMGCSTPPEPLPLRYVKTRVAGVTADQHQAFLWVKFTDTKEAWPVRIVDDAEIRKMVPGTPVLMVRVTDTAGVGQEVRGPRRPNEPTRLIMVVP